MATELETAMTGLSESQTALNGAVKKIADKVQEGIDGYTANDVLTKIKTVDGSGSGLDADLLDGMQTGQSGVSYIPYVNASGNVGIGTNNPFSLLNISKTNTSTGLTPNPLLVLTNNQYTAGTGVTLGFGFTDNSIGSAITGRSAQSGGGGSLTFETRSSAGVMDERMRITEYGNVIIGTATDNGAKLQVNGNFAMTHPTILQQFNFYSSNGTIEFVNRDSSGAKTFTWYYQASGSGTPATLSSSGVWTNASDARGKTDIKEIGYGLDTVLAMKPSSFTVISDNSKAVGFIAQELLDVLPEVVHSVKTQDGEDRYTVDYGAITSVLVKALQEQQEQINSLKLKLGV